MRLQKTGWRLAVMAAFCAAIGHAATVNWNEPATPTQREEFQQILSRLDLGGDMLFVAHTRGLPDKLFKQLAPAREMPSDEPGAREVAERLERVDTFLRQNGFYAVHGVGTSSVPDPRGDFRSRIFLLRDYVDSNLPLWRGLVGWQPRRMSSLDFLPPNTDVAEATTADIGQLWRVLREGVATSRSETAGRELAALEGRIADVVGTPMDVLLEALRDEYLFSVQLAEDRSVAIPMAGDAVTIPEPAFLICMAESDGSLRTLLEAQFAMRGYGWETSECEGVQIRTLSVPLPAPFPLRPAIATSSGFVLISSTKENLEAAITAHRHHSGLLARPRFKQATRGVEMVNNAFSYRSNVGAAVLNRLRAARQPETLVSAQHPAAARLAHQALGPRRVEAHAIAVLNWKSGIMIAGNTVAGGQTIIERLAGVPLAKWLAPANRSRWMAASNAMLERLALPKNDTPQEN